MRGKGRDQLGRGNLPCRDNQRWFPSPCGEKVGINGEVNLTQCGMGKLVSVPLRGKGRDQPGTDGHYIIAVPYVSVPLRGKGRDQPGLDSEGRSPSVGFPSPCGEKVGINATAGW